MKVENNKIVEATEGELYKFWLDRGYDDIMDFVSFLRRMKELGVKVK